MGLGVVFYFVVTTTIAIVIGLGVAQIINPGHYVEAGSLKATLPVANSVPAEAPRLAELPQKLITLLPSNPLTSMVEGQMLQVVLFAIVVGVVPIIGGGRISGYVSYCG